MNNIIDYDWVKIGTRIKQEREKANLSLGGLADKLKQEHYTDVTRQTLSEWEKGKKKEIPLYTLLALCNIFQCDMGYLLCEYDTRTREKADIQDYTGLSEQAINNLHAIKSEGIRIKKASDYLVLLLINQILSDDKSIEKMSGMLSTIAAMTEIISAYQKIGKTDEHSSMYRDGAVFGISRIVADKVESTVGDAIQNSTVRSILFKNDIVK